MMFIHLTDIVSIRFSNELQNEKEKEKKKGSNAQREMCSRTQFPLCPKGADGQIRRPCFPSPVTGRVGGVGKSTRP